MTLLGRRGGAHPLDAKRISHLVFVLTLLLKGALGVVQILSAVFIAFGLTDRAPALVRALFQRELSEDPTDFIASRFIALADKFPGSDTAFYGLYFTVHGLLHIAVVACLLLGLMWTYPMAIAVLLGFVAYQAVEWAAGGGVMLVILSAIDLVVIGLTIHEWRMHRARNARGR